MSTDAKGGKCLADRIVRESRVVDKKVYKMVEREIMKFQRRKK